jgi:hypothetical protein
MSEHEVTLHGIYSQLGKYSRGLQDMTRLLADLDLKATEARETYSMAYEMAYLKAGEELEHGKPMSIVSRKSKAFVESHALRKAAEALECCVRDKKAEIRALENSISVGRSLGSLAKAEIEIDKVR